MKHLETIASKHAKQCAKEIDVTPDVFLQAYNRELLNVRNALLSGRLCLGVDSVSRTGDSRIIVIKYIKDNELWGVSDMIYRLAGCRLTSKGWRIYGGGMDMLFEAQYTLFLKLCPKMRYQDKMKRYHNLM